MSTPTATASAHLAIPTTTFATHQRCGTAFTTPRCRGVERRGRFLQRLGARAVRRQATVVAAARRPGGSSPAHVRAPQFWRSRRRDDLPDPRGGAGEHVGAALRGNLVQLQPQRRVVVLLHLRTAAERVRDPVVRRVRRGVPGRLAAARRPGGRRRALGNEVLKNLALVGVGAIDLIDFDRIEHSNLSRS
ncbi:MAG: hypothetical protein HC863_01905, partial [Myxococcales bacterium]|nr:hypothetical protein [Myxococcales bacterium]